MQLRIRARDLDLPPETRRGVDRRLRLAVGRHVARIAVARVTLSPRPEPGGADGVCCRIHVRFREGRKLVVEDLSEDALAAATRAAWRLEHRLDRDQELRASRVA